MVGTIIKLKILDFKEKHSYDGSQIKPLWALSTLKLSGDSIVVFRGAMRIEQSEMVDAQDIVREQALADILISGDDCIHFIIEMFDTQPASLKLAYHRLHLLAHIAQKVIEETAGVKLEKKGTDLYYEKRKLNVGIATCANNSAKIHFGLNVVSSGVPKHVQAVGLHELTDKPLKLEEIGKKIAEEFIIEIDQIENDIAKTRTF